MSENGKKKKNGFMSKVRNTFLLIALAIVIFLTSLFGGIFPGLNDVKDNLMEQLGYYETVDTASDAVEAGAPALTLSENTITIQKDDIMYMGEEVTADELESILDEAKPEFVTIIDDNATQRAWNEVEQIVISRNIGIKEEMK